MNRLVPAAALAFAACATLGTTGGASEGAEATPEKMVVTNVLPFDIAVCSVRPLLLANPTEELIQGALLSVGPAFQECFIDAKAVDGTALDAKVRVTVGAEVSVEVTGTGVSPAGKECLVAAAKRLPFKPLEAGAKPVIAEVPAQAGGKSVVFGINPASDVAGTIRLAQPSFCACYAELAAKPAPVLAASITLSKEKPVDVAMAPNELPTVAACLTERLKALSLPVAELQLPYQFLLKNSYAEGPSPDAVPALKFQQLDGLRAQRTADVLVAVGQRMQVARAYDAVVAKYKSMKPEKSWTLIGELKTKCAAVVSADDTWIASLKGLVGVYQSSLAVAQSEKAKDPAWAPVEDALNQQMAGTNQELARVEGQKKADEGACPKSK